MRVSSTLIAQTVDLKYVLSTQVIQVRYEDNARFFSIATVSTRAAGKHGSNISESLGALRVDDAIRLYIVDWDTTITIEDNVQFPKSQSLAVRRSFFYFLSSNNCGQLDFGISEQPQVTGAYAAVGGLDEQIAQIRDLIEIPLQRPELFRHFRG